MTVKQGDALPEATFLQIKDGAPAAVALSDKTAGRKVVIFALPGAFTRTCSAAHIPSFIRTKDQFDAKGVDEVICVSVNDPFVMDAWGQSTGATDAGITMLADPQSLFTTALGMNFDYIPSGFIGRSLRYAMLVENGRIQVLNAEEKHGVCELSAGETLLEAV